MAVNTAAVAVAIGITLMFVVLHFTRGTGWEPREDVATEVLEQRAESVPETDFAEPMNRSIGGGGAVAAVGGEAVEEGELAGEEAEAIEESPADIPEDEVEYYEVEFAKQGETIEVANDETILEQGEDDGMDLPYACRQGQCVSCAGQIQDGAAEEFVEHDGQEMLGDAELDDGYTLTCVAYPRDSFTIETGEAP
ncbi:MAG: 2Fe-2S iron-sulfur cluster-binding protein [Halolamina sp.]